MHYLHSFIVLKHTMTIYIHCPLILLILPSLLFFITSSFGQEAQPPPNDECVNAVPLSLGEPVASTTTGGATAGDLNVSFLQCGGQTFDEGTPGVWFTIGGTGAMLKASTCSTATDGSTAPSSPSHRITVHKGDECDSLICLDSGLQSDPECSNADSSSFVEWQSVAGELYFVLVHDPSTTASGGAFELTVTDIATPPANDQCENAEPLVEMATVGGTTLGASEASLLLECGSNVDVAPSSRLNPSVGVWYSIPAYDEVEANDDGSTFVFLCTESAGLNMVIFSGSSCGEESPEITCLETTTSDDTKFNFKCSLETEIPSYVSFNATMGVGYLALVYGADNATFGITFARTSEAELISGEETTGDPSSASNGNSVNIWGALSGLWLVLFVAHDTVNLL
jgi:hypothetical protein